VRYQARRKMMIVIFALVLIVPMLITFYNSKKEYQGEYSFVVSRVEISATKTLELYDMKRRKISFWNYAIMSDARVSEADSVYKAPFSRFLFVFKKNNKGEYKQYLTIAPSGLFPYEWFCN
jgi:hypothetical protein